MMIVDDVDVEILKRFQSSDEVWRGTITELSESLDVSERTIENRLRRLEETGVILYYDLNLTPWIYGGTWVWGEAMIGLDNLMSSTIVIEALKAKLTYFDDATSYTVVPTGSSHDLSVTFHAEGEEDFERQLEMIKGVMGVAYMRGVKLEQMKVSSLELDDSDWRMIAALKRVPKRGPSESFYKLGIGQDETRLSRLIEARKLFFLAGIDFARIENWAHIHVKVTFQKRLIPEEKKKLDEAGIAPPHRDWNRVNQGTLAIEPRDLRELKEMTNKIINAGMKIDSLAILDSYLPSQPWLDKLLMQAHFSSHN